MFRGTVRERKAKRDVSENQSIFVDGEWRSAASGATREILDPADAQPFALIAEGGTQDADAAVAAARRAFDEGTWPATPVAERAALLRRVADLLVRDREKIGLLESRDAGKTLEEGASTSTVSPTPSGTSPIWSSERAADASSTPGPTRSTVSSCTSPSVSAP